MFRHSLRSQGKHVQIRSRLLGAVMLLALVAQPIGAVPVLAQGATAAAAAGTISGTITDASGTPLAGATVTISGPQTLSATTDSLGHYSIAAPPGIYRLLVRAPGFAESVEEGITVAATAMRASRGRRSRACKPSAAFARRPTAEDRRSTRRPRRKKRSASRPLRIRATSACATSSMKRPASLTPSRTVRRMRACAERSRIRRFAAVCPMKPHR
jgi:hypothetical protein